MIIISIILILLALGNMLVIAQQSCVQLDLCASKNEGKCMTNTECELLGAELTWDPTLCSLTGELTDCGCCYKKEETSTPTASPTPSPTECKQTHECIANQGKCTTKEDCTATGLTWDPTLCSINGQLTDCGCCYKKEETSTPTASPTPSPTECKQTHECIANQGKCTTKEACTATGLTWDPTLCSINGQLTDCGCCYKKVETRSPTKSPTKPCKQTPKCSNLNGKCISPEQCPQGYIFDFTKCKIKGQTPSCGCCYPPPTPSPTRSPTIPTKEPTKPCLQSKKCSDQNGTCRSKSECTDPGFEWSNESCGLGINCGCCKKKPVCSQTSKCSDNKGTCVAQNECPLSFSWRPDLCSITVKKKNIQPKCGCCIGEIDN